MLLLYMDEATAFLALSALAASHCVGTRPAAQSTWRLRAADAMIARELPQLHTHLASLQVSTAAWLPQWHASLFTSTLPLDTAARVWDCYLRDGEPLLWRVSLAILRLLAARILATCPSAAACLEMLHAARASDLISERAVFQSLLAEGEKEGDGDGGMSSVWADLSQRLPVPSAEEGGNVCYDLWCNSDLRSNDDESTTAEGRTEPQQRQARGVSVLASGHRVGDVPARGTSDTTPDRKRRSTFGGDQNPIPCAHAFS